MTAVKCFLSCVFTEEVTWKKLFYKSFVQTNSDRVVTVSDHMTTA